MTFYGGDYRAFMTKSLKGITAKRANAMLASTGSPFWQEESYDRLVLPVLP